MFEQEYKTKSMSVGKRLVYQRELKLAISNRQAPLGTKNPADAGDSEGSFPWERLRDFQRKLHWVCPASWSACTQNTHAWVSSNVSRHESVMRPSAFMKGITDLCTRGVFSARNYSTLRPSCQEFLQTATESDFAVNVDQAIFVNCSRAVIFGCLLYARCSISRASHFSA